MTSPRFITVVALILISLLLGGSQAVAGPARQQTEIPDVQYQALVALYNSTDGPNWTNNTGWLATDTPCSWYGVTCTDGHVVRLYLPQNQLAGTVPSELGSLANLEELNLYGNALAGTVPPELGTLASLRRLHLEWNQLTGAIPPELGSLVNLTHLTLGLNELAGTIPPELGSLVNLQYLGLNDNQLTGTIPPELGKLVSLQGLDLSHNRLTGTIPPELLDLANLTHLHLSVNELTGNIPSELGGLANLVSLGLGGNQLTGTIPSELGNLANLAYLNLGGNQLIGAIPPELGRLAHLVELGLGVNQLTGTIPRELGDLTRVTQLVLAQNQLTGTIPSELGNLANLRYLHLGFNELNGTVPSEFGNLANLGWLWLCGNQLTGPLPRSFMNLRLSCFHFNDTNLCEPGDDAFQTWLAGIPNLRRTGVICSEVKPWTLMFYFAADNDAETEWFLTREFTQLPTAARNAGADGRVLVFWDSVGSEARYQVFVPDGAVETIPMGELSTGDPQVLSEYIRWAKENHPADHYALIVIDHGQGLGGAALDNDPMQGDWLTPKELRQALTDAGGVDILYMHACLMGNIETHYQMRGLVDYYVGSESIAHAPMRLDRLAAAVSASAAPEDLAVAMAHSYHLDYSEDSISVVRMAGLQDVVDATSALAALLRQHLPTTGITVWGVMTSPSLERFGTTGAGIIRQPDVLVDLHHLAHLLGMAFPATDVAVAAEELKTSLHAFVAYNEGGTEHPNAHGVSIACPQNALLEFYTYDWLDFAGNTDWVSATGLALEAYHEEPAIEWGPMLVDYLHTFAPDAEVVESPPEPIPLAEGLVTVYLPLVLRNW